MPLLLPERFGPAFRTNGGRGRVRSSDPAYSKAICLALVGGFEPAIRSAVEIDRRATRLLAVAPKVWNKGAEPAIGKLLTEGSVSGPRPAAIFLAGRQTACSSGSKVPTRYASSPPEFWDCSHGRISATLGNRRSSKNRGGRRLYDPELEDLPPKLRWREWMMRVEAVICASTEPVSRETLSQVVGNDCSIDMLIDDLVEEMRNRRYELVSVVGGRSIALGRFCGDDPRFIGADQGRGNCVVGVRRDGADGSGISSG